jgi:hypothetical protein
MALIETGTIEHADNLRHRLTLAMVLRKRRSRLKSASLMSFTGASITYSWEKIPQSH